MKPVEQFEAAYKPLFEGSKSSVMVEGKVFTLYKNGHGVGFITQFNSRHFSLNVDGFSRHFYSIVDLKRFMTNNMYGYFYSDKVKK